MTNSVAPARAVLEEACARASFDPAGAEPVRLAENEIWRLPDQVIVRIARAGQWDAAVREVRVARWLADNELPAVRALPVEQPVEAAGRPATFWAELPRHEIGTVRDVVVLLKQLHPLPLPGFPLDRLDPFVRVAERIEAATSLSEDDRAWLRHRHAELREWWEHRPMGLPECLVHGDAWVGNVARTAAGPILMDFERASIGPPEWDLVSTAVKLTTTGTVTESEYAEFCQAYGRDVTEWEGYELLAGARELRMTTYAAQHAATRPEWQAEAQYRVDCLRGRAEARPWRWKGIM
ncbi:aminoglycoside phosphotransferase family protein [Streptomyces stelliscabiei]|uniref:Aminoglycoside phosphotransferase (APT) family kinase protein n=1 Tax=Streptomyces stelliscabiei TaxID=146820 RepID=A0A8I0NUY2_9ACTN|nr:aminoglycoside phosphotransferase family protein [Streptomyces stelliscabiei]KND23305.1 aminoglycoside phosphotransferase [Streptomyces stelliscabiei]MBE1594043.1 aminoglycoside phosphotransferase (APT) family kinase protein [Streptomyces stelliscabiei]MDX2521485.1 aminoglycoside phosphotransferase family protein [Streptomyces stelliscabiei]